MKNLKIEQCLRAVYDGYATGCVICLHAAQPDISQTDDVIAALRELQGLGAKDGQN